MIGPAFFVLSTFTLLPVEVLYETGEIDLLSFRKLFIPQGKNSAGSFSYFVLAHVPLDLRHITLPFVKTITFFLLNKINDEDKVQLKDENKKCSLKTDKGKLLVRVGRKAMDPNTCGSPGYRSFDFPSFHFHLPKLRIGDYPLIFSDA